MKTRTGMFVAALALAVMLVVFAPQAQATPTFQMCLADQAQTNGLCRATNSVEIQSDGVDLTAAHTTFYVNGAVSANPGFVLVPGGVTFVGGLGVWTLNVTTGTAHGALTAMDLNSVNATSSASGVLSIYWEALGFAPNPGGYQGDGGGTLNAGISSVLFEACYENDPGVANLFFCGGPNAPSIGSKTFTGTGAFSGSFTGGSSSFTGLMEHLQINAKAAGGLTSGDFSLTAVPEPTSIVLLGGVLMLTVGAIRRKRNDA